MRVRLNKFLVLWHVPSVFLSSGSACVSAEGGEHACWDLGPACSTCFATLCVATHGAVSTECASPLPLWATNLSKAPTHCTFPSSLCHGHRVMRCCCVTCSAAPRLAALSWARYDTMRCGRRPSEQKVDIEKLVRGILVEMRGDQLLIGEPTYHTSASGKLMTCIFPCDVEDAHLVLTRWVRHTRNVDG